MRENLSAGLLPAKAWPLEVMPQSFEHPGESRREENREPGYEEPKKKTVRESENLLNLLNANHPAGVIFFSSRATA